MLSKYMIDEITVKLSGFLTTQVIIKPSKLTGVYHLNFLHVYPEFRDRFVIPDLLHLLEVWQIKKKYDDINIWTEEELRYLSICFDLKEQPKILSSLYE